MIAATMLFLTANAMSQAITVTTLEPAFSATILSTYPDGRISKLWLNRDGSFMAEGRQHDSSGGHWALKNGAICMHQTKPFPIPFAQYCAPVPHTGVTEAWTGKAVTGEPITIRLMPGR